VTTEVCVHTTLREANDRGYDCLVPNDCVASYKPELHDAALAMITSQDALFGWTTTSPQLISALSTP
jgi:nicotinamidase-related amidase